MEKFKPSRSVVEFIDDWIKAIEEHVALLPENLAAGYKFRIRLLRDLKRTYLKGTLEIG